MQDIDAGIGRQNRAVGIWLCAVAVVVTTLAWSGLSLADIATVPASF
jgi:hypothetical protein